MIINMDIGTFSGFVGELVQCNSMILLFLTISHFFALFRACTSDFVKESALDRHLIGIRSSKYRQNVVTNLTGVWYSEDSRGMYLDALLLLLSPG